MMLGSWAGQQGLWWLKVMVQTLLPCHRVSSTETTGYLVSKGCCMMSAMMMQQRQWDQLQLHLKQRHQQAAVQLHSHCQTLLTETPNQASRPYP
jgi:hypothetical protein